MALFTKLHRDHGITDDLYFAALILFNGGRIFRCETFSGNAIFHYLMPTFDAAIVRDSYLDEVQGSLVGIKQFCEAIKSCVGFEKAAREKGGACQIENIGKGR